MFHKLIFLSLTFLLFTGGYAQNSVAMSDRLQPCPHSPNCVSSVSGVKDKHYIEPFSHKLTPEEMQMTLRNIIQSIPRTKIIIDTAGYMKVEFKSFLFRFVDDVEFAIGIDKVHIRSASRVGKYDFGANRKRVEKIRKNIPLDNQISK
jgi:uncharacterized protein (DUF1499 family)